MPIFDYKCSSCGNEFEKIVKRSDEQVQCPKCGEPVERQLSAPGGYKLKGEGFFRHSKDYVS